jgi:hypothetical protein
MRSQGSPRAFAVFLVDHQLVLRRLLDRELSGVRALEDLVDVERRAPELMTKVAAVGHQPAESVSR